MPELPTETLIERARAYLAALEAAAPFDELARFAVFLDFRGDRIARQRNYDCFDPF